MRLIQPVVLDINHFHVSASVAVRLYFHFFMLENEQQVNEFWYHWRYSQLFANKMKRLFITFILVTLVSACTVRGPDPDPKVSQAPGEVAFGPLAGMNEKQYLFEQHALFRNKFNNRGVESKINGDTLELTISGNITFSINSAKLNWNVHEILDRITPVLKEYKHTSIQVFGHSDARGDKVINQLLSEQRARVIREYFIRSGIDPQRIISRGLGDEDLLISDDITTVDRALNRRITMEITVNDVAQGAPDSRENEGQ